MSLRNSPPLTSRRLDANRRNARRSTGPRSEAGKARMKFNALRHGGAAAPENEAAVMRALGENPERYEALQRELATAYGPGDALWGQQLADLARLYWRRNRLERMLTGLMRQSLAGLENQRRALARALAEVTFQPSQCEPSALGLPNPAHPCVRRRLLISFWGALREQVGRRFFTRDQGPQIERFYQGEAGWRPRQIGRLLGLLSQQAGIQAVLGKTGLDREAEARAQEVARLVEEQIAAEEAAFAEEMQAQQEQEAIGRDACLAPQGKTWEALGRQEAALDRSIDRKVRILLALRREQARLSRHGSRAGPAAGRGCGGAARSAPPEAPEGYLEETSHRADPDDRESPDDHPSKTTSRADAAPPAAGPPQAEPDAPRRAAHRPGRGAQLAPANQPGPQTADAAVCAARRQAEECGETELEASAPLDAGAKSSREENPAEPPKSPEQSQDVTENKGPAAPEVPA